VALTEEQKGFLFLLLKTETFPTHFYWFRLEILH
jgi:hypothetical protein